MLTEYSLPPPGFHFSVHFLFKDGEQKTDIQFQSVSGLSIQVNTETVKEGGGNLFELALPNQVQYSNLVLKRGLMKDSRVADWCMKAFKDLFFEPVDIVVSLLNGQHEPLLSWNIVGAWPLKWSVSDFNAEQNALVIETMELKYKYFELKKP
jgi:phage tail-like protein